MAQIEVDDELFECCDDVHALSCRLGRRRIVEINVQSGETARFVIRESDKLGEELTHVQSVVGHDD